MKILCISDTIDPLVYSSSIQKRFGDAECVIAAGDLPMPFLGFIASSIMKPVFFVFGNHNLKYFLNFRKRNSQIPIYQVPIKTELIPQTFGATYINERSFYFKNVIIAGLGGCRRYNKGPNQFTETGMIWKIIRLLPRLIWNKLRYGRFLDILVTHAPPLGIHDQNDPCHQGFSSFLWLMKFFRPRYLLHGHVHLYDMQDARIAQCYDTVVINVFGHYLLDMEL